MLMRHIIQGFTLVEVIIYLALFSILMSGILVSVYPILTNTDRLTAHVLRESEVAFITEKIRNALSLTVTDNDVIIVEPSEGETSNTLRIEQNGNGVLSISVDTSLTFCTPPRICSMLVWSEDGSPPLPLNNERVYIDNLNITHSAPTLNLGRSIDLTFTANGETVGPIRYYFHF
jgi:prepilin-type N-terminal cleavage/methylation domain-containing protein